MLFEAYLDALAALLGARLAGAPPQAAMYETYDRALVQLSDEFLKEMYMNFMLLYMGEYTDEVLERCRIEEVNEVVLGFSEMATIKIGELMNVPRNARMQQKERGRRRTRAPRAPVRAPRAPRARH